jgi:Calcineurin-like phosphoesterase/Bacterial Ig domain/Purple acid Phosphatase, N-terminal domain
MNRRILHFVAALLSLSGTGAVAQVPFTGSHGENFDSMGTAGAAPPAGWSFYGALGGGNSTWTTTIPSSGVGGGTVNAVLTASTVFSGTSNTSGWNYALPSSSLDRALGTSPTSGQGLVLQLALTNDTGSAIGAIRLRYDIRRFTVASAANQLPGYWLFYSVNGGTTWQNVTALNPTLAGPAGVIVPNSAGVTTVPATTVTLGSPWTAGGQLLLRWVDDNAQESSPDQIVGLDNVVVDLPVGSAPTVAMTSPGNGSTFATGSTIPITADAMDADGSITKVEFFQGATKLGEDATAPYEFAWVGAAAGNYGITARASDNSGNTTPSAPISVSVIAGPSGTLTRGPYLNQANQNSIVVRWRSSQAIVGRVRYGTSIAMLDQSADEPGPAGTEHEVRLTGLTPYTRYYYSVGSALDVLAGGDAEHTFRTSPVPGTATDTRIWVLGDAGRADANQAAVRDAYYAWTGSRTPDLCLMLGDNAYNSGTDSEYQAAVFNMYPAFLRKMPLWSCLGNHDANNGSTSSTANFPYFDMFTFPTNGECGGPPSGTERYFSFDYGNIHFINLDSQTSSRNTIEANGADGAMAAWLRNDLAGVTSPWIIAFFHHPPYSKGSHNSDTETQLIEMRARFGPILETGGVDLVLTGHSHSYERSFLLDGHYGLSGTFDPMLHRQQPGDGRPGSGGAYIKPLTGPRDHFGAVYTLTGSAGSADGGPLNHPAMFVSYNTLGSFNIDIVGNQLTATYIESDGDLADTFTIIKQGAADSDGDGVADAFEIQYGMNRFSSADALLDTDKDGNTALAEYLFGLIPTVPDRYAWTTSRNPATGYMEVSFPTHPQRTYQVFWTEDLSMWHPASAVVNGDGSTMLWIDDGTVTGSVPAVAGRRFYRVNVQNGP